MFASCVCCVLSRKRSLRRADHSFRGFLLLVYVLIVCDLETPTVRRLGQSCAVVPQAQMRIVYPVATVVVPLLAHSKGISGSINAGIFSL